MSDDKEFSWDNNESVIFQQVDATAVYTNEQGEVVIRQQNPYESFDQIIVIPSNLVNHFINAVKKETASTK